MTVQSVVSLHFIGYNVPFTSVHQTGLIMRSCLAPSLSLTVVSAVVRFATL